MILWLIVNLFRDLSGYGLLGKSLQSAGVFIHKIYYDYILLQTHLSWVVWLSNRMLSFWHKLPLNCGEYARIVWSGCTGLEYTGSIP
jgi:hypothetical protein